MQYLGFMARGGDVREGLEPLVYTINEAAELLRVHRATVYRLIAEGKLERVYIGPKAPRVTRESLVALVENASRKTDRPGAVRGALAALKRFGL